MKLLINVAPDDWQELYYDAKDSPCSEWMYNLPEPYGTRTEKVKCELPDDHEDEWQSYTLSR